MKHRIKHFVKYIALILVTVGTLSAMSIYMMKAIIGQKNDVRIVELLWGSK